MKKVKKKRSKKTAKLTTSDKISIAIGLSVIVMWLLDHLLDW